MASDTVPAAAAGEPARGLLASMVAPVEPARPAFDLTPTGPDGTTSTPPEGTSSAAYHGDTDGTQQGSKATAAGKPQQGIVRAWLLAGAERWRKGGDARNKRLDVAKAKAQSQQVKEARTVTVNRGGGLPGKGSAGSGAGGKSLGSKNTSGGAGKGPKNSSGSATGPSKRSGSGAGSASGGGRGSAGGRGPGAGGPAGGKAGGGISPKGPTTEGRGRAPKPSKGDGSSGGASGRRSGTGKSGTQGPAGSAGKNGTGGTGSKGTGPGTSADGKNGKSPASKDSSARKDGKTDGPSGKDTGTKGGPAAAGAPSKDAKQAPATDDKTAPAKPDAKAKPDLRKGQTKPQAQPGQQGGTPISTRDSRETGYRDGTRAAKAVAHVQAYRDGVIDGYGDTTQAAARDKTRLDQAHAARQAERDKEQQPVSSMTVKDTSSADHHQPQPIPVKDVTATHVLLGAGAARTILTRGEVRSLKGFERRLRDKTTNMQQVAEATKGLQAHALQQAAKVTQLREAARAVKGGEKLAEFLSRLEEHAKAQALKAAEIHKRAVRAAEACTVVLANAETRYGGIYQAVVDSPETAPAELAFYKE